MYFKDIWSLQISLNKQYELKWNIISNSENKNDNKYSSFWKHFNSNVLKFIQDTLEFLKLLNIKLRLYVKEVKHAKKTKTISEVK